MTLNLNALEEVCPLSVLVEPRQYAAEIASLKPDWLVYNPRKPEYRRSGISLTSLEGKTDGIPDLDSLLEFNRLNNKTYSESDFKTHTPYLKSLPCLAPIFDLFGQEVSRSHILRFERGGLFPPHRDHPITHSTTFRLFSVLTYLTPSSYHFVLNGHLRTFVPGYIYYINTHVEHSLVSFTKADFLVMNVDLTETSVKILQKALISQ